ncbi:MAG: hypothetical protein OXN89_00780 [Bryobacterales bacterium]|nr:hypothetical protein [Bryobacterales bacterium]
MNEQPTSRIAGRVLDGNVLHIWYVDRLWRLSRGLEVVEVPIDDLSEFDSDEPWYGYGVDRPTCRSVATHAKKIQQSDLTFPIILSSDYSVLDGMHRVAKAWMLGLKTVSAVRFDEPIDPDLVLELTGTLDPQEILKELSKKRSERAKG